MSDNLNRYFKYASHSQVLPPVQKTDLPLNLSDAAYTLHAGRKTFKHRRMFLCRDAEEAVKILSTPEPSLIFTGIQERTNRPVVFMFSGQGSQYVNMGLNLYKTEPEFRKQIDFCAEFLKPIMGFDLRSAFYSEQSAVNSEQITANSETSLNLQPPDINHTAITQPVLFTLEYALAKLWMEWGIQPRAMIGHSIGEYAAACLADVFSLEDALTLVAARGKMIGALPRGDMLAVPLSEKEAQEFAVGNISLAVSNAPSRCVLSGTNEKLREVEIQLKQRGIESSWLHTSHAFHSHMMDEIIEPFTREAEKISLNPPQIPFISNVTGTWIKAEEAADPAYWAAHLRSTVRFSQGVRHLMDDPDQILLEIGPGQTLCSFARQQPNKTADHVILSSMRNVREQKPDDVFLLTTLGKLWMAGASPDWEGFHSHENCFRVPLPTYPFERKRYWIEAETKQSAPDDTARASLKALEKKQDISEWFYIPSWQPSEISALDVRFTNPETWLIFADKCGLGMRMAQELKQNNQDVVIVKTGAEFVQAGDDEYVVNPAKADDYHALISRLAETERLPDRIIHLWSVSENEPVMPSILERLDMANDSGLYSLIFLVQSLGKHNAAKALQLLAVSNGIHKITGNESLFPEKAAILGPVKIIPLEYPNIRCRSIDIETGTDEKKALVNFLLKETLEDFPEPMAAYRNDQRWIQTFEPVKPEKTASRLKEKGVYLITGGLGGIGLALGEYLGRTFKAKLVLTGRSAFPDKKEWKKWLEDHDESDETVRKIMKLQDMEASGAEILIYSANASDHEQMKEVIESSKKQFGRINGVIHCAGLADYEGVIQKRTREMTEKILAPKVKGALVLESLLKDADLDFFMLFSSLGNMLYKAKFGQAGYNAANEFIDAFAVCSTLKDNTIISVNWDDWQKIGMSARAAKHWAENRKNLKSPTEILKYGLLPQEGIKIFNHVLEMGKPRIAVSTRDLNLLIKYDRSILETGSLSESLDTASSRRHSYVKKHDIADWFYLPSWKQSAPPELLKRKKSPVQKLSWLIFTDDCGIGNHLADLLKENEQNFILVKAGSRFVKVTDNNFIINPGHEKDYNTLFSELQRLKQLPSEIVHMWTITQDDSNTDFPCIEKYQSMGFYSLLFISRAAGKLVQAKPFNITVVSNNIQQVTGEETLLCPAKASLLGCVKVIPQEYPDITCKSIDIVFPESQTDINKQIVEHLWSELSSESTEAVVAYRGNRRWVQTFEAVQLEKDMTYAKAVPIKKGGVWMITGGLGKIGLVMAEYLLKKAKAKLILTGRSEFPSREEWDKWLADHGDQDNISMTIRKLTDLENAGAEIMLVRADAANEEDMQKAVSLTEKRFGKINGLIHCAGITAESTFLAIEESGRDDCEKHFQPKIQGSIVLDKIFSKSSPDICIMTSSLASILGGLKSAAYSAANIFMDAFVHKQNLKPGSGCWMSINWERWKVNENMEQGRAFLADLEISFQEGADAFERILSLPPVPQIIVSSGDLQDRLRQWLGFESISNDEDSSKEISAGHYDRPALDNAYEAPRNKNEKLIAEQWQRLIGIRQIGIHDNFFDLGGDSLLAVQLISWMRDTYKAELSMDTVLNTPTIAGLSEIIEKTTSASTVSKNGEPSEDQIKQEAPLICLQPHGKKCPVFFIHAATGNAFAYSDLSRQLGTDQPFYAPRALGLDPGTSAITSIEDMAAAYIKSICKVHPEGPYILGGICVGGIIAYEMAQQLLKQGKEVPLIVMLDTYKPDNTVEIKGTALYFLSFIYVLHSASDIDFLFSYFQIRGIDPAIGMEGIINDLESLSFEERMNTIWECSQGKGVPALNMGTFEQMERVLKVFIEILRETNQYVPKPYPGRILLFRATEVDSLVEQMDDSDIEEEHDPTLGWGQCASLPIEVYEIPGSNHFTIYKPPYVELLAQKLAQVLDKIAGK